MVPTLAGNDGVEGTTVSYLLTVALKKKKEEEEEKRRRKKDQTEARKLEYEVLEDKLEAEMDALMAIGHKRLSSRQSARLLAVQQEWLQLVERRRRRATKKKEEANQAPVWVSGQLPHDASTFLSHCGTWESGHYSTSPFVLAVSCAVSWCCLVRQRIQSMRQFTEAT